MKRTLSTIIAMISMVLFTTGFAMAQEGGEYGGQTEGGGEYGGTQEQMMDTSEDKLVFDSLDMDGDMQLSREEFVTGMYNAWDKDGNGTIDQQEWDKAVQKYGISDQYADIPNPDGVDQQAFMDWSEQAGLYEKWDQDGDGTITREEFDTAKQQMEEDTADEQGDMDGQEGMGGEEEDGGVIR